MPRCQRKNTAACREICTRFIRLIEEELGLSLKQASSLLGYANATTLWAIKKGKAFPDLDRLLTAIDKLRDREGRKLNLNWLFTGRDQPFADQGGIHVKSPQVPNDIIILWKKLSPNQKRAFKVLLEGR